MRKINFKEIKIPKFRKYSNWINVCFIDTIEGISLVQLRKSRRGLIQFRQELVAIPQEDVEINFIVARTGDLEFNEVKNAEE